MYPLFRLPFHIIFAFAQIKQQEIAARKRIIQNPVQMDVIKEKVNSLLTHPQRAYHPYVTNSK